MNCRRNHEEPCSFVGGVCKWCDSLATPASSLPAFAALHDQIARLTRERDEAIASRDAALARASEAEAALNDRAGKIGALTTVLAQRNNAVEVWKKRTEEAEQRAKRSAEAAAFQEKAQADASGCPCTLTTPCSSACTCANQIMSGGCNRCCRYGSEEQRKAAAEAIVERERGAMRAADAFAAFMEKPRP